MQRADVYPTPALSPSAAPTRVTTTLYDVLAALQTVVEPEEDDVVVWWSPLSPRGCVPGACAFLRT
jgi:hypothetical protein